MASSQSRIIPLVIALVLAGLAIALVNRQINLSKGGQQEEEKIRVVVTNSDLTEDANGKLPTLSRDNTKIKEVPRSAVPPTAIQERQWDMVIGQQLSRPLANESFIQPRDLTIEGGLSELVSDQKWAISVSLNGGAISSRLRPDDHVVIVGTLEVEEEQPKKENDANTNAPSRAQTTPKKKKVTTVILPDVRILALSGNRHQGGDEFVLELPPQEALVLLAAQSRGIELSPVLRKRDDATNRNRKETKLVDDGTFNRMIQGVESIEVPTVPRDAVISQ